MKFALFFPLRTIDIKEANLPTAIFYIIAILFIGGILFYNHRNVKTESFIDIVTKPERYVSLDALDNYGSAEWSEATSSDADMTLSPMYLSNLTNTKDIEEDIGADELKKDVFNELRMEELEKAKELKND